MRTFMIVALFVSVIAASAIAQAPAALSPKATAETTQTRDFTQLFKSKPLLANPQVRPASPPKIETASHDCLTMRSYLMKREEKMSDVTRQRGYTTCTPASRFHFKAVPQLPRP